MFGLVIGLAILILDIYAIFNTLGSAASVLSKALWIVLILAFPIGGALIWYFFGPRG